MQKVKDFITFIGVVVTAILVIFIANQTCVNYALINRSLINQEQATIERQKILDRILLLELSLSKEGD